MTTWGNVFDREACRRTVTIHIAKAHRFEYTVQAPLSSRTLAFAFVFLVPVKANTLFGLALNMIHEIKVGRIGVRPCDPEIGVNIPVPTFKLE